MLDVKEAAQRASEYYAALYSQEAAANVRLEEVELSDDDQYWLITLSYPRPGLEALFGDNGKREYKQFKIEASTGKVLSMKIRKV